MEKQTQLLKYGFVVYLGGKATYDHFVKARIQYADALFEELKSEKHPVLAKRFYAAHQDGVQSPLFSLFSPKSGIESFQSAYYLADTLMRKGVLPVYIEETGEVKDLTPLLENEHDRADALLVVQILRARYIQPELRQPTKGFMVRDEESQSLSYNTVELSDTDMLAIFGKLPTTATENVVELTPKAEPTQNEDGYIQDDTILTA